MTSQHFILVADDDPSVRRLLVRVARFVAPHMEVVEAQTGAEALAVLQQHAFTVIITDYHMPGNTGLDIVLAAHAQWPTLPIIVVSARPDVEAAVLAAGATLFIAKPFTVEQVAAALRLLLPSA